MNKIGYKNKSYKDENYQLSVIPTEEPQNEGNELEDALKQIGFQKAIILIRNYLMHGQLPSHEFIGKQLFEIKKRFFEPI